jgi:hypothetical protein
MSRLPCVTLTGNRADSYEFGWGLLALIDVTSDFEYEQDQMMKTTGGEHLVEIDNVSGLWLI